MAKARARRPPIPIAVFSSKKKPMEAKAPPKPKVPKPRPPREQAANAPVRATTPVAATAPITTPIDTNYKMGNVEEPGIDIGGAPPRPREIAAVEQEKPKLLARARK